MLTRLRDTLISAGILLLTVLVGYWFDSQGFGSTNIVTVFVLGVLFIAVFTGSRLYSLVSSLLFVLAFDYFFSEPRNAFGFFNPSNFVTFIVMLVAAFVTGTLAIEAKRQARRSAMLALRARREQLRASLLPSLSHDLRTPLTTISGNAGLLMASADMLDDEKKQKLYKDIYDDSQWLIHIIENLLHITRLENGKIQIDAHPELVSEIIEESLKHIDRRAEEHRIEVSQADHWIMARMDSSLIVRVLINLINNAIAHTEAGTVISVTAREHGGQVIIEVLDDGQGIPDEEKRHLFDLYDSQRKASGDRRRGFGLGLPLCKAIVDAHGGEIGIRDNQPQGSIFYFTLKSEVVGENE